MKRKKKKWQIVVFNNGIKGEEIHVMPINDLQPHYKKNCNCGVYLYKGVWVHPSFDKRELFENCANKLPI